MNFRFLSAAAIAAVAIGAAAPAMAQEEYPWTGFYVGVNAGGTWGDTGAESVISAGNGTVVIPPQDITIINTPLAVDDSNDFGFAGGAEIGYNWQAGALVFGIEGDIGWMDIGEKESATFQSAVLISPPITYTVERQVSTDWYWTLRPRVGYAAGNWLVFVTGGIASTEAKMKITYADTRSPPNTATIDISGTETGWIAGGGVGYAFGGGPWSVKAEWLYANFGTIHGTNTTPSGFATLVSEAKIKSNIVRLGVDFRF